MAETLIFHCTSRDTVLHRLDARTKLLILLVQSAVTVTLPLHAAAVPLAASIGLALSVRIPVRTYLRELKVFALLALLIAGGRYVSTGIWEESITAAMRFSLVVILGLLFMDSTSPDETASALYRFLSPVSKTLASAASVRLMLTLSLIPAILDSVKEIREARLSRGDSPGRRPLRWMVSFSSQVLETVFDKAASLSDALDARGFTQSFKPVPSAYSWRDAAAWCLFMFCTLSSLVIMQL